MKIAIPLADGKLTMHFGHCASFPLFVAINTDMEEISCFANRDPIAPEAGCNALKAICGRSLDVMICDGEKPGFYVIIQHLF